MNVILIALFLFLTCVLVWIGFHWYYEGGSDKDFPRVIRFMPSSKSMGLNSVKGPKYVWSEGSLERLKIKLMVVMVEERPFLDPGLKLEDLADRLGLTHFQFTQLILQGFDANFDAFVNEFRVEHVLNIYKNNVNQSIYDLYYDAGFNNQATFREAFKGITGKFPSEVLGLKAVRLK